MSTGANNLALTTGNRRLGRNNRNTDPDDGDGSQHWLHRPPASWPEGEGMLDPWNLFEERVRTGPFGLVRFPSQPHSPVRIFIIDDGTMNPQMRQFVRDSPPRIRGRWHLEQRAAEEEPAGLTHDEFRTAMRKIKKQIYNPNPRRGRWSMFNRNNYIANQEEQVAEEKQCAVCLEVFVPNEEVLLTPCNHMFHNDCLVPWVRNHGQCPVCRFELCQRRSRPADQLMNNDIVSLIRAMEEAFEWVTIPHHSSH